MKTLTSLFLLLLTTAGFAQQDRTITIMSGGIQRTFDVHLPSANPAQNLPVLISYHGSGGSSAGMAAMSDFNTFADQNNFVAVYPQSLMIGGGLEWNMYVDDKPGDAALNDPNAPDDILFTHDMIDKLATDYSIDRKRVYASGVSNGGYMCYALSLLASNEIAAIAPVAGNLEGESTYLQKLMADPAIVPIPVMHVHGTADNTVAYPDPDNTPKPYDEWPLWVPARGCGATTYSDVIPIMNNVDKLVFCTSPEVFLIRIKGMDHAWTNGEYPTSKEIVKFFNLIQTNAEVATSDKQEGINVPSSIADKSLRVVLDNPATLQLFNTLGESIYGSNKETGSVEIPTQSLGAGMYILRVSSSAGKTFSEKIMVQH